MSPHLLGQSQPGCPGQLPGPLGLGFREILTQRTAGWLRPSWIPRISFPGNQMKKTEEGKRNKEGSSDSSSNTVPKPPTMLRININRSVGLLPLNCFCSIRGWRLGNLSNQAFRHVSDPTVWELTPRRWCAEPLIGTTDVPMGPCPASCPFAETIAFAFGPTGLTWAPQAMSGAHRGCSEPVGTLGRRPSPRHI